MTETTQPPELDHRRARPFLAISDRIASEAAFRQATDAGCPSFFGWLIELGGTELASGGVIATAEWAW